MISPRSMWNRANPIKQLRLCSPASKPAARKDAVLVDAASILTTAHRSPELAERLLRDYLSSPSKSDGAPAFKVHVQLGDLLRTAATPQARAGSTPPPSPWPITMHLPAKQCRASRRKAIP